ncbi:hypothetical protein [Erythrobacter sp. MTPC3]
MNNVSGETDPEMSFLAQMPMNSLVQSNEIAPPIASWPIKMPPL